MNFENDKDEFERHRREDVTVELIKSSRRAALKESLALQKRSEPWLPDGGPSLAKIDVPNMNKLGARSPAPSDEEKRKAIYLAQIRAAIELDRIPTILYT